MSPLHPGPAYRIVTPRLIIRCWDPKDAAMMKESIDASKDHVARYLPWALNEPTSLEVKIQRMRDFRGHFDLGQNFSYGIFDRRETHVLGGCALHLGTAADVRYIGYWIHVDFTHRGLATEAAAALTRVAFEIDGVRRLEITMDPENLGSKGVAEKLGYVYEGTLRQDTPRGDGTFRDHMIWSLLREDYRSSPSAKIEIEAYDAFGRLLF
jgi:RimJ/RimL family protein N-acetyltransferase